VIRLVVPEIGEDEILEASDCLIGALPVADLSAV
jgi:hypothetical protein